MLPSNYLQACRLCLTQNSLTIDIFECSESSELYMKILACLPINVTKEDKLPKGVCTKCVSDVNIFYQFWLKTLESQKQLLTWLDEPTDNTHETSTVTKDPLDYGGSDMDAISNTATSDESSRFGESEEANYLQEESNDDYAETGDDYEDPLGYGNNFVGHYVNESNDASSSSATDGERSEKNVKLKRKTRKKDISKISPEKRNENMCTRSKSKGEDKIQKYGKTNNQSKNVCRVCGKKSGSERTHMRHMKEKGEERKGYCKECDVGFHEKSDFISHNITFHDEDPFQCDICKRKYTYKWKLLRHMTNLHLSMSCVCELCGKVCRSKSSLKRHVRSHSDFKHECPICHKNLSSSDHLKRHIKVHTGNKDCICPVCGKAYNTNYIMDHMRIHTGERRHKCEHCGKLFTQRSSLRIHVRLHTGEKPFICSFCGEQFITSTWLRYHLKRLHPNFELYDLQS